MDRIGGATLSQGKFGTAINCIDGRVQEPVARWLKQTYGLDYVDMITEPGADRVVAEGVPGRLAWIEAKVRVSVQAHSSRLIAVAGHDDCAGNPVSREEHWAQIRRAVEVIRNWGSLAQVVGLWVDANGQVQQVPC